MPKGGSIKIILENYTINSGNQFLINKGHYNKIVIIDKGTGINPDHIDKIYDPFFTTKREGSGLGLSITHSIIKKHNGYIFAHSIPGKGTIFEVYLPALPTTKIKDTRKKKEIPLFSGEEKILIMDDNELILQGLTLGLNKMGYKIVTAKEGNEAIALYKKAKRGKEPFSIIILDLTIAGGLGGKETIAVLKEFDPDIKAIVSSGYSHDPILSQYRKYGFSDKLAKPYNIKDVCMKIRALIDNYEKPL